MCFNDVSRVMVTFVSKQKGNFKNGGTTNCKGYFHFIFPKPAKPECQTLLIFLRKKLQLFQFTDTDNNKKDHYTTTRRPGHES